MSWLLTLPTMVSAPVPATITLVPEPPTNELPAVESKPAHIVTLEVAALAFSVSLPRPATNSRLPEDVP